MLIGPLKWRRVVRAAGLPLRFGEALLIRLGSQPIRQIAPLKTGEAATVLYLRRVHGMDVGVAAGTVLFEKGVNLWATVLLITIGLAIAWSPVAGAAAAAWVLLPFLRGPWRALADALRGRLGRAGRFSASLLDAFVGLDVRELALQLPLALLFIGLEMVNSWLLLRVVGVQVPLEVVLIVVGASFFLNNVPITLLGIGMRESVFVIGLAGFGDPALLLVAGLLVSTVEYIVPTLVGLLFMRRFLAACAAPPAT